MGTEPDADFDRLLEGWVRERAEQLNAAIADAADSGIQTMLSLTMKDGSDYVQILAVRR